MNPDVTTRRSSYVIAVTVLLLAAGLFAWGLQYKLSLYDLPGSQTVSIPHAKLLSEKERPVALNANTFGTPSTPELALALFSAFLLSGFWPGAALVQTAWIWLRRKAEARPKAHLRSSYFSFRPPPALALSR
ncbi:MAG: hypothetical protein M3Y50_17100 [Acidobacteriota bacterium]|nr:hypothetical protein [Acidobacteriota bacterium]